jgi:hypothetical protein
MNFVRAVALAVSFVLLTGCGGDGSAEPDEAVAVATGGQGSRGRCALLTAAEVEAVIGPHDGGVAQGGGSSGIMGCRWTADRVQEISDMPPWRDAVEVAQFDATRDAWARGQMEGTPVADVVDGALYDESYGDLWFTCAGGRVCVVKVRTASSAGREESAVRLARLISQRL